MATRGRHAKDDGGPRETFTGRVRRWTRTWVASREPKSKELKFRRWLQTDERPPELAGPRHALIEPYKEPGWEPYPKHRMVATVAAAPAGGVAAGVGGPPLKRGKSTASMMPDSSAAPAASQQPMGAPAPKFKLKITLGPKPQDGAAGAAGAAAAGAGSGGGQPPAAAAAGMAGGGAAAAAPQQPPHFAFPQQQAAPPESQTPSFAHTLPAPQGVAPMLLDNPPPPPQPF